MRTEERFKRRVLVSRPVHVSLVATILVVWFSCVDSSEQQSVSEKPSEDSVVSLDEPDDADVDTSSQPQHVIESMRQPQVATGGRSSTSGSGAVGGLSVVSAAGSSGAAGAALAAAPVKCSSTPSTYHEESQFTAYGIAPRWTLNRASSQPGTSFTTTKRGPASNPGLCSDGCALLAFTIPAGEGWGGGAIVDEWFAASTNLNGATVVAKLALEVVRPHLPVNVRVYAQGDAASNYAWGTTGSVSTATVSDVSRFHEVVLRPSSRRGSHGFCAANVGAIGIQVQRTRTTTDEIPVKLYIKSVVVGQAASSAVDAGTVEDAGANQGRTAQKSGLGAANRRFGSDGYCELAKDGAISVASDDWVAAGSCQGYGYTYMQGNRADTKVVPKCDGSRCVPSLSRISTSGLCANGTIAADPTWKSKVGLGFDFDPSKARSSGIALTYHMAGTAILRLQLADTKGNYYCADLDETDEATTLQLPWEFLTSRCWDRWDPGVAYNPAWPIQGLQLVASCRADKNSWFDMCLMGLATF